MKNNSENRRKATFCGNACQGSVSLVNTLQIYQLVHDAADAARQDWLEGNLHKRQSRTWTEHVKVGKEGKKRCKKENREREMRCDLWVVQMSNGAKTNKWSWRGRAQRSSQLPRLGCCFSRDSQFTAKPLLISSLLLLSTFCICSAPLF